MSDQRAHLWPAGRPAAVANVPVRGALAVPAIVELQRVYGALAELWRTRVQALLRDEHRQSEQQFEQSKQPEQLEQPKQFESQSRRVRQHQQGEPAVEHQHRSVSIGAGPRGRQQCEQREQPDVPLTVRVLASERVSYAERREPTGHANAENER